MFSIFLHVAHIWSWAIGKGIRIKRLVLAPLCKGYRTDFPGTKSVIQVATVALAQLPILFNFDPEYGRDPISLFWDKKY